MPLTRWSSTTSRARWRESINRPGISLISGLLAVAPGLCPSLPAQSEPVVLTEQRVLLHSHADLAGGLEMAVHLQQAAAARDIDAVVLTEQLLVEWQWAPPLIRRIWNYRRREPSVRTFGIERYFRRVAEYDAAVPAITLLAGVEVAPYYRWTGAPWKRDLSMWDWQRNILVFGLPSAGDYARLPVTGLRRSPVQSVHDVPWLAALIIVLLCAVRSLRARRWIPAALFGLAALLLLYSGPPPTQPFSIYRDTTPTGAYQALIDTVRTRGGFSMWTQVEAIDDHPYAWGLIHTEPHPQVLVETTGYAAFGSLYPATSTAQEPGREWDQALGQYLAGERTDPVWGWAEAALHYPAQLEIANPKRVDGVVSVILAPDRSPQAVLEGLRTGRGYALLAARPGGHLRLESFAITAGDRQAGMGETLTVSGPARVRIAVGFTGSEPPPVEVRLIRSGEVIFERELDPPFSFEYTDLGPREGEAAAWYRLMIFSQAHRVISNPIFMRYEPVPGGEGVTP